MSAQDTIYKVDGTRLVAKVLLVSDTIACKRFDNLQGPTYLYPKSTIREIHYSNGMKDVFAPATVVATIPPTTPPPTTPPSNPSSSNISEYPILKHGARYRQGKKHLSEADMLLVAGKRTDDPILLQEISLTKTCRRSQHFAGAVGALAFIGFGAYLIDVSNYGGKLNPNVILLPVAVIVSEVTSIVLKVQRKNHALNVIDQYNRHE
jgi:hypothetical protein